MASAEPDKDPEVDPEPHTDKDHGLHKCTYCEALKVPESKRTPGMRAIIKQERLQLEIGKYMMDYSRFRRLVEVGASQGIGVQDFGQSNNCLMKALLLVDGLCVALKYDTMTALVQVLPDDLKSVYSAAEAQKTVLQRAKSIKRPMHMLAAVPLVMVAIHDDDYAGLKRTADVALRAIELNCADWHDALQTYGISTKDVEMVLHVTLANMYCGGGEPPGMNYDTCYKAMAASVDKLWRLDPGNAWGALFTTMVPNNKQHRRKVLKCALAQAEKRGDEGATAMALWEIAYSVLLGWEGPTFEVAHYLDLVKRAEEAHQLAASWGYTQVYNLKRTEHIWRCRGVAAGIRADIRAEPRVADNLHVEYTSEEDLDLETRHVMCENCKELKETLVRCSQCHEAKYCSKECQKKHWVQGGHKRSCKLVQKKVTIGPVGYADKWV